MRLTRFWAIAALAFVAACSGERAEGSAPPAAAAAPPPAAPPAASVAPADTSGHVYADSTEAIAILARLRALAPTGGSGFDTAYAPRIDPAAVLSFVSDSGLVFQDVNDDSGAVHLSRDAVAAQLAGRRGRAFVSLVHLAHIYSQPYPQYSHLAFTRGPGGLQVAVADWYRLVFAREHGRLRLRRVSYVNEEVE